MMLELFGRPWLITETWLKTTIAIASRETYFADVLADQRKQALEARDGTPLKNARSAYKRESVAVIPVVGPLIRHADMFSEISGATSYAALRKDLQAALDDSNVSAILLNIDSPGGEANGCFELSDAIYAARKIKPVRAYVGGMGASAAYAIACACEDITCAASAELGSIGVRAGYLDASKAYEEAGLKEWVFVSSQSPYKAFDVNVVDDRGRLQVVLDDLAQVFVEQVARNREVEVADVLSDFGKGDVMVGQRAVDAGLADRLGDFESLLTEMNLFTNQPGAMRLAAKEKRMTVKASTPPTPAVTATVSTGQCDKCASKMTGNSYCQTCFDDEEDEDDDEDAKALGVDKSMSRADRRARISALVATEQHLLEATGAKTPAEARGKLVAAMTASVDLEAAKKEIATMQAAGVSRDLRATLEAGLASKKLNLGAIQKRLPIALRGKEKAAWAMAMSGLTETTPKSVVDAACGVALSADDHEAIAELVKGLPTLAAAETTEEPLRDPEKESAELSELDRKIKAAADNTRKTLDRGSKAATKK